MLNRGANSINSQTEPGGAFFFVLHIRANRWRAPDDLYGKSAPADGIATLVQGWSQYEVVTI